MWKGLVLCAGWGVCGAVLQCCCGEVPWEKGAWPVSGYLLLLYGGILGVGYVLLRRASLLRQLTSCQVAVPALLGVWGVTLLMGLFPQVPEGLAAREAGFLHRVGASWPLLGLYTWLSLLLGWVVLYRGEQLWRRRSWTVSDLSFCCFHLGLWLVGVAGALGHADEIRLRLPLRTGVVERRVLDGQGKLYELPFGVKQEGLLWQHASGQPPALPSLAGVEVGLYPLQGKPQKKQVRVNRPVKIDGWSLYAMGYEGETGVSGQVGILEAVYNPWIPGVQAGIVCLMAGAVGWLLQTPSRRKEERVGWKD
ncbi:ResB-like protein [gut metagenome]|uniref:ResB-like protein n=1 Tax=gut metagenome TaxID=749906 RepID=J9G863_9ZZZZ